MLWRSWPVSETRGVLERLHQTLVEAERDLRLQAEAQIRAYHALMQDLVHRLGLAEHLDEARHADPHAPAGWGPAEWRAFFDTALGKVTQTQTPPWGMEKQARKELERLTARIAELEAALRQAEEGRRQAERQIQALQERLQQQARPPAAAAPKPSSYPASDQQPYYQNLRDTLKALPIPSRTTLPIKWRDWLPTGNRYQRAVQVLWLLGQGMNIRLEIDWVLAQANGLKPRSGSIRRLFQFLEERGLITEKVLRLKTPQTRLSVVRLTNQGRDVVQALGFEVREGEWERLTRLHEGDRFPAHTVAVLIFALHARLRGWQVEVMPEANGKTPPDVLVAKDGQRLFVEVERGEREKAAKWRNIAQLNDGRVALCAMTPDHRALLVGDCKKRRLPGVATDLEGLISVSWAEISTDTPLWLEEWA